MGGRVGVMGGEARLGDAGSGRREEGYEVGGNQKLVEKTYKMFKSNTRVFVKPQNDSIRNANSCELICLIKHTSRLYKNCNDPQ